MENFTLIDLYQTSSKNEEESFKKNLESSLHVKTDYEKVIKDTEWIKIIEDTIPYLDNIFRAPNRFIINEEEVVKIERARRITVESIKNLSRNTNFIQEVDKKTGDVKPSKILNIDKEESYDTYENRLIYTLIQNMKYFVSIKKKNLENVLDANSKNDKLFEYSGNTRVQNQNINLSLSLSSSTMATQTDKTDDLLENIKIVKISDKVLLIVLMSNNGTIKDCIVKLTDELEESTIEELANVLNKNLKGTPLEKLNVVLTNIVAKELSSFSFVLGKICESIKYEMSKESKKLSADFASILDLPEFSDVEKAKNFVNMLSTKDIIDMALKKAENNELGIIIGSESKEMLLRDYSIISLDVETDNKKLGKISVVGPKRIDYSKTVATLKYIDNKLKSIFNKNKKEGED